MLKEGYAYIPKKCLSSYCDIHLAFHGCAMSIEYIGFQFVQHAGYNEIAELNNFIILYPQIERSEIWPRNHAACWDTYGYTDWIIPGFRLQKFFSHNGSQAKAIMDVVDKLQKGELEFENV